MSSIQQKAVDTSLNYATTFDEKLLGVGCDVEIVVNTESGDAKATIAMRSFLRASPSFNMSLEELIGVVNAIQSAKSRAALLANLVGDATDHQLNYETGCATLIVVQPPKKKAFYTLSIGAFSREGELDTLSDAEVSAAVQRVESLKAMVCAKVMAAKPA